MRAANCRDFSRVPRMGQPVVNCSANAATLDRRLSWPMMPRNEQEHSVAAPDCPLERFVNRLPRLIEVHAVKVEDAIGLDRAGAQAPVPCAVERVCGPDRHWNCSRLGPRCRPYRHRLGWPLYFNRLSRQLLARKRGNRCRYTCPKFRLFRAELAHEPLSPWAAGSTPRPIPTSRRQSRPLQGQRPRKCRTGSAP